MNRRARHLIRPLEMLILPSKQVSGTCDVPQTCTSRADLDVAFVVVMLQNSAYIESRRAKMRNYDVEDSTTSRTEMINIEVSSVERRQHRPF